MAKPFLYPSVLGISLRLVQMRREVQITECPNCCRKQSSKPGRGHTGLSALNLFLDLTFFLNTRYARSDNHDLILGIAQWQCWKIPRFCLSFLPKPPPQHHPNTGLKGQLSFSLSPSFPSSLCPFHPDPGELEQARALASDQLGYQTQPFCYHLSKPQFLHLYFKLVGTHISRVLKVK